MEKIEQFINKKPLFASIALLALWFVLASLAVFLLVLMTGRPMGDVWVQNGGRLAGIVLIILFIYRADWVDTGYLRSFGTWKTWAWTALIALYFIFLGNYAFFGDALIELSVFFRPIAVWEILFTQTLVGLAEEMLFRGVIFAVLLRGWASLRRGVVKSMIVSALLFALPHLIHLINVQNTADLTIVLFNALYSFIAGVELAGFVYLVRSVYPASALHALGNAAIMVQGLNMEMLGPVVSYLRLAAVEMVILVIVLVLIWKETAPSIPKTEKT